MNPENALSRLSPGMAECHARLMAVAKHGTPEAFSATLAAVLQRAELSISNAYDAGAKSIQVEAIGACGVSGPLVGQPQAMPDLSQLTERGAKAWAGVDAQGLREGFTAADMATASAQGFRDGVASVSAGWISVDERLPEVGVTVLVYEPFRHGEDWPGTVRILFDYICPDYEDWHDHCASHEHFMAVGGANACGPDVTCTGPSEKAPYTHWMPLPAAPGPADGESNG